MTGASPRRPRVAIVVTRLNIGGPARLVTSLATEPREFDSVLLAGSTGPREGSMEEAAIEAGARVTRVPGLRREPALLDDLRALLWLYRYFRRERPDVVATHMAKAGALGRLAAWLARVPVRVHTFHGHVLEGYFGSGMSTVFRWLERILGMLTTRFVAISPAIAAQLSELRIGQGKISIIRIGFDLEPFRRHEPGHLRREFGLPPSAETVGVVGRLVPVKGHEVFLGAAARLLEKRPSAHFFVVGDGERWDELHMMAAQLGLDGRVHFTGWRHDLVEVYSDLDVVVCCSHMEGTPSTVIEAGAAGRPVIGTRVGGLPDIISDGVSGLLVEDGDVSALATSIQTLLDQPQLARKMGAEGTRLAFSRHSSVHFVEQTERLYLHLLQQAAR